MFNLQLFGCKYIKYYMKRDLFQAIADPTRRAILLLIATQALTPNSISQHFETSRQAVSKHIKILSECEIISSQKEGREIFYKVKPEKIKEIDLWLEQFRKLWEDRFNQLDDVLSNLKKGKYNE